MPIIRDTSKPQHDMETFHYGALPLEGMPTITGSSNLLYYDQITSQWYPIQMIGATGIEINWDSDNSLLEIYLTDRRVSNTFSGNAVMLGTIEQMFDADSILLKSISNTFTADSVLS